jgi:putative transposase
VIEPNELGRIVLDDWYALPERLPHIRLDQVQLMPDHFHAIIVLDGRKSTRSSDAYRSDAARGGGDGRDGANGPLPGSLGAIIGAFKSGTTIRMNRLRGTPGHRHWQKGFHDWRIRPTHAGEFERIARYIADNPAKW